MIWSNSYIDAAWNRIISISRSEASPTEPVSLTEVKIHLKITDTDNDTELTALITRCRQEYESRAGISIVAQTIIYTGDLYNYFDLPYGPITSITEVKHRTGTSGLGVPEYDTLTNDDYVTDAFFNFKSSRHGVHKITYVTGMATVRAEIKERLLNIIAIRYEHKGDALNEGDIAEAINKIVEPDWVPCI